MNRLISAVLFAALAAPITLAQNSELISVGLSGNTGAGASERPAISADSRYVAFESTAGDLVAGDANGQRDIFLRNRYSGVTELVSIDSAGFLANGPSERAALSSDGRVVAFVSSATNLVASDTNGFPDIFVHDCETGVTRRVSISSSAAEGNGSSDHPAVSGDGRYVGFTSAATNLVAGDLNGVGDVFVHDLFTGATERVSVATGGAQADAESEWPSLSYDGRYLAFASLATNLGGGQAAYWDIVRHDRALGATAVVTAGNGDSRFPSISDNGARASFQSTASNLVGGDTNGKQDVFARDLPFGSLFRVSVDSGGGQANGDSFLSRISPDATHVAFKSDATNLVTGDGNGAEDIFLHGLGAGSTVLVSVGDAGQLGNDHASRPAVSASGTAVAYQSDASNLVAADANGSPDVLEWTRAPLTVWVDWTAAPGGDGSVGSPFSKIQDAIDSPAVVAHDTVNVRPGTYVENLDLMGKPLSLLGTLGATQTILDGGAAGSVVRVVDVTGPVSLDGFTVTNGSAFSLQSSGGGIQCDGAHITIQNCHVSDNRAWSGGGLHARASNVVAADCVISANEAGFGAGSYFEACVVVMDRVLMSEHHSVEAGGAIYSDASEVDLTDCQIVDNANDYPTWGLGFGIYATGQGETLRLDSCEVLRNGYPSWYDSGAGAGMYGENVDVVVVDSVIQENGSSIWGGAIRLDSCSLDLRNTHLSGNTCGDKGGALYAANTTGLIEGSSFVHNATRNQGGALHAQSCALTIRECVFDGNATSWVCYEGGAINQWGGSLTVERCLFSGNVADAAGAAVFAEANVTDCSFIGNTAEFCYVSYYPEGGACVASSATTFHGCLFWSNSASQGGGVYGPALLEHCTLIDNSASPVGTYGYGGGGGAYDATLLNCIAWGNQPEQVGVGATATYSIVEGGWPGVGNIDDDPDFWLPTAGNFHLKLGSPAIDAGDPASPLDPDGTRADMGAFPYTHCVPVAYCAAKWSSGSCLPEIASTGTLTFSGPADFHITASNVPNLKPGLLVWGGVQGAIPLGGGTLCISPPIARTALQFSGGSAAGNDCSGTYDYLMTADYLQGFLIQPGQAVFAQYWYRDPGFPSPNNIGLSNALAVEYCP